MAKHGSIQTNEVAHAVQFYTHDDFLLKGLCEFVRNALAEEQSVLLIMTAAHRKELAKRLRSAHINVRPATEQGRYITCDANEMLSKFRHGETLIPRKALSLIGSLISRANAAAPAKETPVAVFGEMVGVLWSERKFAAAIELEQLWNELAKTHHFYLRCAYPANGFGDEMKIPYATVCAQHSHVIPGA